MNTKELLKLRQELITSIDQFADNEKKIFDQWSLKDIIAHLSGWNLITLTALHNLKLGTLTPWGKGVQEINKENVQSRLSKTWQEVRQEFIESSQKLLSEYETLSDDLSTKFLYRNKRYTPLKFLQIDIDHYREHLYKIKSYL
ncbi:ClbS/DfsB family four-helix bundle protein [Patescibacteria group bacterium]|nr:ClbS/DfsB family four-helix bundle protein [Patescibacteria group bacterium]